MNPLFKRPKAENINQRIVSILFSARLIMPLMMVTLFSIMSFLACIGLIFIKDYSIFWLSLLLLSLTCSFSAFLLLIHRLRHHLLRPLVTLESAVAKVCEGEPDAHLPLQDIGVFYEMVKDIDSISEELTDLYEDMDSRVSRQTMLLQKKTTSLKILYDVAVHINRGDEINPLLVHFLEVIKKMSHGIAATARIVEPDGTLRIIGALGPEKIIFSAQLCTCGTVLTIGDILCKHDPKQCSQRNGRKMFGIDDLEVIAIPLNHQDTMLGIYHIYVKKEANKGQVIQDTSLIETLSTIGNHLGMAIAQKRLDEEAQRLSIIDERTAFAHELHDSLAQTLAGLRFQIRMLEDEVAKQAISKTTQQDIKKLRNGLDEAHTELRELLSNFRAPLDTRGLIVSLEALIERFGQENQIHTFFQCECRHPQFTPSQEMQVLRIVQEALTNIQKHAQAQTVRVLLSCPKNKLYTLLIEDDGIGFKSISSTSNPGEHIGLSIMQERANRLGGHLYIESEPNEGVHMEIIFDPNKKQSNQFQLKV